ncbi:PP2C family protein-serine/threonine phosphatase [Streptomyces chiangmaiensis]
MIDFPELVSLLIPERGHSYVSSPLFARGLVLGVVVVWRTEQPHPFDKEDADLLAEIASRAALSVDNARRYTREHHAVLALQQRLLPPAATDTAAAETVGFYRPAGGGAEISGDWFDVIPLPSLRVSLVVGDVAGHGLHATATMGRLRTGVQTLADLELDPAELLTHLVLQG